MVGDHSKNNKLKHMTNPIKLKLLFFFFAAAFFSCNERTTDKSVKTLSKVERSTLNLSGQVYLYAPDLDKDTCQAFGECDCCAGSFLFLNDTDFLTIDVCESDDWYYKGKYKMGNGTVVLTYDSLMVEKNYNWEKENDTTGTVKTEYFIKSRKANKRTSILTRIVCEKNICFKTDDKQTKFATLDKKQKLANLVKQLKDDGIWDKLEIK
jgi:hypothetical protein